MRPAVLVVVVFVAGDPLAQLLQGARSVGFEKALQGLMGAFLLALDESRLSAVGATPVVPRTWQPVDTVILRERRE